MAERPDAVVIGAGPNGLVAANLLADAGWDVLVLEAQPHPGGAVRSAEVTVPGFVNDLYSSFYPLAAASPPMRQLRLEEHGLRWSHAPAVLAHPLVDGPTALLSRDLDVTTASLKQFDGRDEGLWRAAFEEWQERGPHVLDLLLRPFPPLRAGGRLLRALGPAEALRFARTATLSVRRLAQERFQGEGAALLLAGNALHTDLAPDAVGSGLFGWLLAMLGQDVGFPVPEGGAGRLTEALVARLEARGGQLVCDATVHQVVVRDGRAVAVRLRGGEQVDVRRAVLADVAAPALYGDLLGWEHLPERLRRDLEAFAWDDATVKVDWALAGPIPWRDPQVGEAGTVHVGGHVRDLARFAADLSDKRIPAEPFLIIGQMSTADRSRSPSGTESAWAYTHVPARPRGDAGGILSGDLTDPAQQRQFVERVERRVEELAPGFRDQVLGRHVAFPADLERGDANLVAGALNGGTAGLQQQLVFRPVPGLGRPETHIEGLYLASSSAHPGGGVHGACGANAARAALRARTTGRFALGLTRTLAGAPGAASAVLPSRAGAASRRSGP